MSTTYGVTRTIGSATYSASGFDSQQEALLFVHQIAFEDGNWSPPLLREKWWQFWRPTTYTEIEAHFALPPKITGGE